MARRDEPDSGSPPPFNSPFRDLAKRIGPLPRATAPATSPRSSSKVTPPARRVSPPQSEHSDEELFRDATRGVVPIPLDDRGPAANRPRAASTPAIVREEAAALAELADLVAGFAEFDISDTDEHVEGMVIGLDPRLLRRLRLGEFPYQSHLDLHGMTADEAKRAVQDFVVRSMVAGHRCVLLVHGRGRNSPDQRSVLKERLKQWLTRGELGRRVLAFSTARPYDGGSGATYVLLRRARHDKKPFRTLDGAKS
jgi:DNA-nicking Smr family endonuclease